MIVIGADTHKQTHTCVAVDARTAQLEGELTAPARKPGFGAHLRWARALDRERIWAIEDCRHVSGSFERFLVACGEKVHRVPPKLMGQSRRAQRTRGKSDPIDALAVARAALKEGPEGLPVAHLDQEALDLKLLLDHREDIVRARAEDQQRLRWPLTASSGSIGSRASSPGPSSQPGSESLASWRSRFELALAAPQSSSARSPPASAGAHRSCWSSKAARP
jgi:transposase